MSQQIMVISPDKKASQRPCDDVHTLGYPALCAATLTPAGFATAMSGIRPPYCCAATAGPNA